AYLSVSAFDGTVRETGSYNLAGRCDLSYYDEARQGRLVDPGLQRAARPRERRRVAQAVQPAIRALEAGSPPAGEMPVVLTAGSSGILLHEAIGHGMEADFNRKGTSIYADKLNKPIAHPFVNIVDDGTNEHARGAINVDDEGNVPDKTMLVENG